MLVLQQTLLSSHSPLSHILTVVNVQLNTKQQQTNTLVSYGGVKRRWYQKERSNKRIEGDAKHNTIILYSKFISLRKHYLHNFNPGARAEAFVL